ncbi:MAG: oxidoreductase [Anaerolineaceae bacterium 4572_32.1]|nr:MAG: oxidoreductase [Anaerolineaceae bacterium 4572_32.1]
MQSVVATAQEESVYLPVMARLLQVRQMTKLEKLFTLELPGARSLGNEPGQFVGVSLLGIGEAPISISSSPSRSNGTFELCVRNVGDVTNAMHGLEPGDVLGIRGPFGHGFPVDKMKGKDILFAAGGLGLAPLRSLINQVLDERGSFDRVIILYGTKHPSEILFPEELDEWAGRDDVEFHMTVDRGDDDWTGNVGVITTLFPKITINPRNTVAAICGPPIMYRFVLMEMMGKGIPETQIYLSLERRMKCGVGKCGHCQINNVYCCQDGPVFRYSDVKGLEEAL